MRISALAWLLSLSPPICRADQGLSSFSVEARSWARAGTHECVQMLEPFAPMAPGVFLYYPDRRLMMPKLRAFIDHMKSRPDSSTDKTRTHIDTGRTKSRKRG